ncbi:MAG: glycosyl transferase family 2 [Acidobacteria bacterium]|nr:MAG: glycosyl transferase family 2 [Acidobacteriota bacterium]
MTFVSVVIATRNRRALLAQTLDALAMQRWPRDRFEIVIADNGSTDGTRDGIAAAAARSRSPETKYVFVATPGKSHAVNTALDLARGDVLAFTDDDVRPEPAWIERLVAAFEETGADFVAGRVQPIWEVSPPAWMSPSLYGVLAVPDNGAVRLPMGRGVNEHIVPIGANMAVRTAVVHRLGGLHPDLGKLDGSLRTGEDHEFFLRMLHAGCRGVYEPAALVSHWVPRERLQRSYVRRWLYQNGRDVSRLETTYVGSMRHLLGVPRYLWRQAAADAWSALRALWRGNHAARVASALRVLWFGGYLRESWFGARGVFLAPRLQGPAQP